MARGSKIFRAEDVPESNATGYPEPFRAQNMKRHARRLAEFAGLKNYGVNMVRVEPGGQSSARHAHATQDELVCIVEGELAMITDAGEERVGAGTWIGFPKGTGDAHHFINRSDKDATFLVIGDKTPDRATYPDIDLAGAHGPDGVFRYTRKDGTPY